MKGRELYTTTKRIELETKFESAVKEMHSNNSHGLSVTEEDLKHLSLTEKVTEFVGDKKRETVAFINEKTGLDLSSSKAKPTLSKEQSKAVIQILNGADIAVLEGLPGAGKTTTMSELARQYKKLGFKPIGVTPSSSAALELSKATGIECKNVAIWRKKWQEARKQEFELILRGDFYKEDQYNSETPLLAKNSVLTSKHVLIIDEASMMELANMYYFLFEAKKVGAKVIFVGDSNQLAATGWMGAFYKAISICGSERLEQARRQRDVDDLRATRLLSEYKVRDALDIYWNKGSIKLFEDDERVLSELTSEFTNRYIKQAGRLARDDLISIRSIAIGVFTNVTRQRLNSRIRERLKEAGVLKGKEQRVLVGSCKQEGGYQKKYLDLARGDQIVFARNANHLGKAGIFNGELATVLKIGEADRDALTYIDLLVHKASGAKEKVRLDLRELAKKRWFHDGIAIDHGYCVTAHKVQGASIDEFMPYIEKGLGYEVFNVLATRHKKLLKIFASKEILLNAHFESLDETSDKARNRFDLRIEDEEAALKSGLLKIISKRANISFAGDYRSMGLSKSDQLLKDYIDTNQETISVMRGITEDQAIEFRRTGSKPKLWDHPQWEEFKMLRFKRAACAKIITNNYSDFKERLVQCNLNYATIEKHSFQLQKSTTERSFIVDTKTTILHEHELYKELVQSITGGNKRQVRNLLTQVKNQVSETNLALSDLHEQKEDLVQKEQFFKDEIELQKEFAAKYTPEYLGRIYRGSGTGSDRSSFYEAGLQALGKYKQLVQEHGSERAVQMVQSKPSLLGDLRGIGLGKYIRFGKQGKDASGLLESLPRHLKGYRRSLEMAQEAKETLKKEEFGRKIEQIDISIQTHRKLLPSSLDELFFEKIQEILSNDKMSLKEFAASELYQSIAESINISPLLSGDQIQLEQSGDNVGNHILAKKDKMKIRQRQKSNDYGALIDNIEKQLQELHQNLPRRDDKERLDQEKSELIQIFRNTLDLSNNSFKTTTSFDAGLKFKEVSASLTASNIEYIFREFAEKINPSDDIEKKGDKIVCGSLHMTLNGAKAGLWKRWSNNTGGDIFSFVMEAKACKAVEALEIIAGLAENTPASMITIKDATVQNNKDSLQKPKEWVAIDKVPKSAPRFNPSKHLTYLKKNGSKVELKHEYRDVSGHLLGYTVRVVDEESGKKQVLPVAYCQQQSSGKSAWRFKGFTDNGSKPIYKIEKLAIYPLKPVLIVEGEKTADSAAKLLPEYNVISWMGGAAGVSTANWQNLKSKEVVIWPDNDNAGRGAAKVIAERIDAANGFSGMARVIDTKALFLPEKWDLADELPKHMNHADVKNILGKALQNSLDSGGIEFKESIFSLENKVLIEAIGEYTYLKLSELSPGKINKHGEDAYKQRLETELAVIEKTGFARDFILAHQIVSFAKNNDIEMGYGRGSAVASLIAYLLGIHKIDPVEHKLSFERFLTTQTKKQPDFDIDVSSKDKAKLENLVFAKYQEAAKLEVRDKNGKIGTHPAAVIFPSEQLRKENDIKISNIKLASGPAGSLTRRSNIDKNEAEALQIRKIDLLSSKVLDKIQAAENKVEAQHGRINWDKINWHDEKVNALVRSADTDGIFQLSGNYAKEVIENLDVKTRQEFTALQALIRPGAASKIDEYKAGGSVAGKQYPELTETRGVILYQEQIMKLAENYLGIDKEKTDDFRRDLAKLANGDKSPAKENTLIVRDGFIEQACKAGNLSKEEASKLYTNMLAASKYSFNKSHAVAYSQTTFKTAYMKAHYPKIFKEIFEEKSKSAIAAIDKKSDEPNITSCLLKAMKSLEKQGRIEKDNYISEGLYKQTLKTIAKNKDLKITEDNYIDSLKLLQKEYRSLQNNYDHSVARDDSQNGRDRLIAALTKEAYILEQVKAAKSILPKSHIDHIRATIEGLTAKEGQLLPDQVKKISEVLTKEIGSQAWRQKLEKIEEHQKLEASASSRAARTEADRISRKLEVFAKDKELAKTPEKILGAIKDEQKFLASLENKRLVLLEGNVISKALEAREPEAQIAIKDIESSLIAHRKQGIMKDEELSSKLHKENHNLPALAQSLANQAEAHRSSHLMPIDIELSELEKLGCKIDKDDLIGKLKNKTRDEKWKWGNDRLAEETKKYVTPILAGHQEAKEKAGNFTEFMKAIEDEQKTFSQLGEKHLLALYALDKKNGDNLKLFNLSQSAKEINTQTAFRRIDYALKHGLSKEHEIIQELKLNEGNLKRLYMDLNYKCKAHETSIAKSQDLNKSPPTKTNQPEKQLDKDFRGPCL